MNAALLTLLLTLSGALGGAPTTALPPGQEKAGQSPSGDRPTETPALADGTVDNRISNTAASLADDTQKGNELPPLTPETPHHGPNTTDAPNDLTVAAISKKTLERVAVEERTTNGTPSASDGAVGKPDEDNSGKQDPSSDRNETTTAVVPTKSDFYASSTTTSTSREVSPVLTGTITKTVNSSVPVAGTTTSQPTSSAAGKATDMRTTPSETTLSQEMEDLNNTRNTAERQSTTKIANTELLETNDTTLPPNVTKESGAFTTNTLTTHGNVTTLGLQKQRHGPSKGAIFATVIGAVVLLMGLVVMGFWFYNVRWKLNQRDRPILRDADNDVAEDPRFSVVYYQNDGVEDVRLRTN